MVCAAPPLRALVPRLGDDLAAEVCLAARGGLSGGEGIPELTSGMPLDQAGARSGVMKALDSRGAGVYGIARSADVGTGVVG